MFRKLCIYFIIHFLETGLKLETSACKIIAKPGMITLDVPLLKLITFCLLIGVGLIIPVFPIIHFLKGHEFRMCVCMGRYLGKIFFCCGKHTGSYDLEKMEKAVAHKKTTPVVGDK